MKRQTTQLAELVNCLQNKVVHSNANTLPVEVVAQVKQIEKLVKQLKLELKGY